MSGGGHREDAPTPHLRLDELLDELQDQVTRVRGARDRIHTLLDAVLAIGSNLDVDAVLHRIVESAVALVDARYGALGVLGEEETIQRFITVGMDEQTVAAIGHYPRGEGILGLLIREPEPLRLADLTKHPDSAGFPAGHPPMHTFLGAPVRVRDKVFGNLYLTDKHGGREFDTDDEAILRTLAAAAGVAIDNARLYADARHREQLLGASTDLTRSLLAGIEPGQVLRSLAGTVRELANADLVTLAVPVGGSEELVVEAAAGIGAEKVHGLVLATTTLAAKVYRTGEPITSDDLSADPRSLGGSASRIDLGPAFFTPLATSERIAGVLQVARVVGGSPFTDATLEMIAGFAAQAALALQVAEHRRHAERMNVMEDRDRIGRDLHDLAVQRLFASGLSLQAVLGQLADRPDITERVRRVIDDLDDTIKIIRSTIYALHQHDDGTGETGLQAQLVAQVERASQALGFTPALRMTGLLDTRVPPEHAEHLMAVLGEALSNVARHANATTVEVAAEVTDTLLRLRVIDNGRGIDPAVARRSGVANLRHRAEQLRGTLTLSPHQPTGTIVEWTVPLPEARP